MSTQILEILKKIFTFLNLQCTLSYIRRCLYGHKNQKVKKCI
nr:MAG TPA: hypothetical protein [Caudoviricetes sp.]